MTGAIPIPPRLKARVNALFGDTESQSAEQLLDQCARVAHELVARDDVRRETALDLLAVDATVTRAVEQLAADAFTLDARCLMAMTTLSSIVEVP